MSLSDATWLQEQVDKHGNQDAAAAANGIGRNKFRAACRTHGIRATPKALVPVVQERVSEEEILRQRVTELERDFRGERKQEVFEERLIRAIRASCQAKTPAYKPGPARASRKEAHEFVLLWSDTHAAEVVSREETNGLNEYDWAIMLRRQKKLTEAVLSFQENRPYPVSKLHVLALGDMLSGNIHEELAETNEFPLAEATVQAGLDFAEWLEAFVPHFQHVGFSGVVGNHPRAHRKPRAKQKFDNADWVMYQVMKQRLARTPVGFEVPRAQKWPVDVCGRRILMFHGDGIRSTMPGVPWGGVMRRVAALQNEYAGAGQPIDHFVCGHFHQSNVVQGGRIVMNGSVKGMDEYSLHAFGGGESPRQVLMTFHPRRGFVEAAFLDL